MKCITTLVLTAAFCLVPAAWAQDEPAPDATAPAPAAEDTPGPSYQDAVLNIERKLEESVRALNELREQIAQEKIPLSRELTEQESELRAIRDEFNQSSRLLDSRTLDLTNLKNEIKSREEEAIYIANLLTEYISKFETTLHISEVHRYKQALEDAKLAAENSNYSETEVFALQSAVLDLSLDRLEVALSGTMFDGSALNDSGILKKGTFVLVGPTALFVSDDHAEVGIAEQRLGSYEPAALGFKDEADTEAALALVTTGKGEFPFDPTLGNAYKIEETQDTLFEHIKKGGPVMIPIFTLAGAALLVAVYKWIVLFFVRPPSRKRMKEMLAKVAQREQGGAMEKARSIGGPTGRMLAIGIEHMNEPRELVEEVMYESVLTTKLKLQRLLPFIAICAASAPLLGLLGTVTGIINTFKLITVFGSGDVKTLSGGISEALITTEYGLIVAIPSLLMHAYLSRKARGVLDQMEKAAVALLNQIGKTLPMPRNTTPATPAGDPSARHTAATQHQPANPTHAAPASDPTLPVGNTAPTSSNPGIAGP
jgi:biopolymer transport protein ExbB